jgi:hypothetical protein
MSMETSWNDINKTKEGIMPVHLSKIVHELAADRKRGSAVRGQRPTEPRHSLLCFDHSFVKCTIKKSNHSIENGKGI